MPRCAYTDDSDHTRGKTDAAAQFIIPGAAWTALGGLGTGWSAPYSFGLGTQSTQFDDTQCYLFIYALREFVKRYGVGGAAPLAQSHLHVQVAANIPTAPIIQALVNSSGSSTDNAANVLALRWATGLLQPILPNLGAQAVFDVELVL